MSTSDPGEVTRRRVRVAVALGVLALIALASCSVLDADHCLRMSDCYEGTTCVEGLCEADTVSLPDPGEGGTTEGGGASPEASVVTDSGGAVDASTDAGSHDASSEASADAGDGSVTDATTD